MSPTGRCLCPVVPDGLLLAGLLGEASVLLGPLGLVSALPSSSPAPTGLPKAPEPSTAPPRRPSVPMVREEKRDLGECELPHAAGGWLGCPCCPPHPTTSPPQGQLSLAPCWPWWPCASPSLLSAWSAATARCGGIGVGTGWGTLRQPRGSPVMWLWPPQQLVVPRPPLGTPLLL